MDTEAEIDPAQSDEAARPRASSIKSLIAKKVREVREVGQRLSKLNKHLSTSDQSDLPAAKLLSFSVIEDDTPRLVRTNAIKVKPTDQRPRSNSCIESPTKSLQHSESLISVKSETSDNSFKEIRYLKEEYNEAKILNDDAEDYNSFNFWRLEVPKLSINEDLLLKKDWNGNVLQDDLNEEMGNKNSAVKVKAGSNPRTEPEPPRGTGRPPSCQQQHLEQSETLLAEANHFIDSEETSSYKEVDHHHTFTCEENFRPKSGCSDSVNAPDLPLDTDAASGRFDCEDELVSSKTQEDDSSLRSDNVYIEPLEKKFGPVNLDSSLLKQQFPILEYLNLATSIKTSSVFGSVASKFYSLNKSLSLTVVDMPDVMNQNNGGPRASGSQPFTLTRHKKVEIPSTSVLGGQQVRREPADLGIPYPAVQGDVESNVLRKVASLTYDMAMEQKHPTPRRPEKHDLSISDKFEGNVLVSNLLSSIDEDHYLRLLISNNDLRLLTSHFVNYLMNIGIICPLEEATCEKFTMDRMYRWGRLESSRPKTDYISVQEHLVALNHLRQESEIENKRTQIEFRAKMQEMEEMVASLTREVTTLRSRPTPEPPPYVPPPSPYSEPSKISRGTQTLHISSAPPPGSSSAPAPPPPPPPPPMMGAPPPPPPQPMMAGPPPPPPPPMMGGPPPPPPPPPMMGGPPPPPPPPMMGGPPPPPPMMGGPPPPPPMMGGPPPPPPMMGGPPPPPPMGGPPPPPGMGSPPSLPPPPAGGWNSNKIVLRKSPVDPKAPMKPLYWTRILIPPQPAQQLIQESGDSEVNLWEKLEEVEPESWDEFTELFSRQVVASKPLKPRPENKPAKQQAIKILDNKRSQAVGILVSSRHLDVQEVESAVYNLDTSIIDLETLQKIFELRATDEELATMRMTIEQQPDAVLDKPETFLLELASVPHFTERVACFMFQNSFFENLATISNPLNNLKLTCEKLTTSVGVSNVLGIVLALGNYMNGGNRQRGQADGFAIDILPKLKDVKSKDNTLTLIFYIVKIYIQKFDDKAGTSDARMPLPEPTDLDKAGQLRFEELEGSMKQLNKEIECIEQKASLVIAGSDEVHLEPFKGKMESFFVQAKKSLRDEEENLEECKQKFSAVLKYFKYAPKKNAELDPKEFFSLWSSFASDFKDVWNREQQRIFKENLEKAKQAVKEKKLQVSKSYSKKSTEEGTLKAKLLSRRKK